MPTQPYTEFKYLYPPRPASKIPFDLKSPVLQAWAKQTDVLGQIKGNGSRNIIFIDPDDRIQMWGRHKELHKSFTPPESMLAAVRALPYPKGTWNVLDSELLHLKTTTIKNTLYLYDVLVWKGEYLLGQTYAERYAHIQAWNLPPFPLDKMPRINDRIMAAQNYTPDQWGEVAKVIDFRKPLLPGEALEGLVLKRAGNSSALKPGFIVENNGSWMCRIRKPHKNAQF